MREKGNPLRRSCRPVAVIAVAAVVRMAAAECTLLDEIRDADARCDASVAAIASTEELATKQAEWRKAWLDGIGGLPERTPLNAKEGPVVECDGFTLQNVLFESQPGVFVTAHLALPRGDGFKPPYPALLMPIGHDDSGVLNPRHAAHLAMAARAGFAALSCDPVGQGERQQAVNGRDTLKECAAEHSSLGARGWLVGWNFARFRIWDGIRAIDWLETRKDVDCSRLGVMGTSGGGTMSAYLQALDGRVKVAFPNCYVSSLCEVFAERGCHDAEQFFWNQLNVGVNHAAMLAMGQPRVALATGSRWKDYFPHGGAVSTFAVFTNMAAKLGFDGPFWHFSCDGPHGLPASTRAAQTDWMKFCILGAPSPKALAEYRALDPLDGNDPVNGVPLPFSPDATFSSPSHQVRDLPGFKSAYSLIAERADELARTRSPKTREELREIVRRRAAIRPLAELPAEVQKPFDHPNFGWWYLEGAYGTRRENEAAILATIGRSVVGRDAENIIIRAAKEVKANGGKPVPLVARGKDCIAAAHAYAAEPQLFSEVMFYGRPPSWTEMVKDPVPGRESFAVSVWGALEEYDWTDLVPERPFGAGTMVLSPRIRRLLDRALDHDVFPRPVKVSYDSADESLPEPVRIGKRLREYMNAQPVTIRTDEELVGWLSFDSSVEGDLYRRTGHKAFSKAFRKYYVKPVNRLAIFEWQHTCADFPKVIREGLEGIRRDIAASREKWAGDVDRLDYLRGMDLALDGIEERARKCAEECRRLADVEADPARRATLFEMATRCERVPLHPARTFDEGVQSVFFCYDFLSDAIGRLDQYLAPLYFADLAAGRITRERAAERLQELFVFIDAHTPHSSSGYDKGGECHMTVGGLARDGSDGWTDFSQLVVESCMSCDLSRPEMSFRWHPGTKREVLRFMLDCERRDPNKRIAFDGDVPRVEAFEKRFGFPPELARDYCITGCNEPTFMGGFSCGGFHMNAAKCVDTIFTERRSEAVACRTWDDFAALFERECHRDLEEADAISKEFNELRSQDCNVLSALFMAGCIDRAKSPTRGGASRLVPVIDLLGTPNVIDSLCIVKQFVFDEKRCTMETLADALAADWKGYEGLLAEIRRDGRFYGSNDPLSNEMARFYHCVAGRFSEGRRDWFGMPLTFGNHTGYNDNSTKFGRLTGATPDGRHAGDFLSFGGGPAAEHGPAAATSALLAAAHMDPMGAMCGTSIMNLSLPECGIEEGKDFEKFVILVETYFREGGLHLQLNHVSRETLLDAQKHPEKYPNLRVRVSGFSGYFVRFKKTIQDEVISRTVMGVR